MEDILIDTDVVIEYLRSKEKSSSELIKLLQKHDVLLSSISDRTLPWCGYKDIFIASIAIYNDIWLRTFNEKHFKGIEKLKIWQWQ